MSFENWLKEDERCPNCNQVTKRQRGITKQNLKRLCHLKPQSSIEWTLIAFFLLFIIIAYFYSIETQQCRDFIKEVNKLSLQNPLYSINYNLSSINLSLFNQSNGTR